jgi:hypothetical protein
LRQPDVLPAVSAAVARFIDRLSTLSSDQWKTIQETITDGPVELTMIEASRNAAVALAVRDLISPDQFDHLYRPFIGAIPLESLDEPSTLD